MPQLVKTGIVSSALAGCCALVLLAPVFAADTESHPVGAVPLLALSPELQTARAELGALVENLYDQGQLTTCAHDALLQLLVDLNARIQHAMLGKDGWKLFDNSARVTQPRSSNSSYDSNYRQATSAGSYLSAPVRVVSDGPPAVEYELCLSILRTPDGQFKLAGGKFDAAELAALSAVANAQGLAAIDWTKLFPAPLELGAEPSPETP